MKKHFISDLENKFYLLSWNDDNVVLQALLDLSYIPEANANVVDQLQTWFTTGKGLPTFLLSITNKELERLGLPTMNLVEDGQGEVLFGPARYARRQKALEALAASFVPPAYTIPQAAPSKTVAKPKKASKATPVTTNVCSDGNSLPKPTYTKEQLVEALLEGIEQMQKQLEIDLALIAALKEVH